MGENKKKRYFQIFLKEALRGFTLAELLVVLALVGILLSVFTVYLGDKRIQARDAKGETEIRQILSAFELKYTREGQYPDLPSEADDISPNDQRLSPHLSPVPYTNGKRIYQWYNKGDRQKFCVFFESEVQPGSYFTCSHLGCYVSPSPQCPNFDN